MKKIVSAFFLLAHAGDDDDGGGVDDYDDKYLDTLLLSWSYVIWRELVF